MKFGKNSTMQSNHKINIACLVINVYVDDRFGNINKFINKFKSTDTNDQNVTTSIYILRKAERKLELSQDWNTLSIIGYEIDDLTDPFNLIGISQAIFRFAAIHLAKNGVFLLHGSAAILDNRIICFSDDGDSTAKTLGSLEIALTSKQYVADEFCFIDIKNNKIFGYPFIPIHVRSIVKRHLKTTHDLTLPITNYKQTRAGNFIQPNKLFHLTTGMLETLSYVHFSEKSNALEKLSPKDACKSFKFCIASHIAKLLHPELDRMQFISMTDTTDIKIISDDVINEIIEKIIGNQLVSEAIQKFTSYKLTVSEPCQIVSFLRAEI
ncbi:hypothetical protein KKC56_03080 [Patescibacteria group bacterium]|nr:hypothetical protein [Patescibacteria group bacterium]